MKKITKLFTAITCVTLASGLVFPTLASVKAETPYDILTSSDTKTYSLSAVDQTYVIGEDTGAITVTAPSGLSVKVMNPYNQKITLDGDKFTPTTTGDYVVKYYITEGTGESAKDIVLYEKVIKVTKSGFYFEFPENTSNIIPSEMNITISDEIAKQGFDGTITLPMPSVYSSKTNEKVEGAVVNVALEKPAGSSAVIDANYKIKPDVKGLYTFTYTYTVGGAVVAKKQYQLNVNDTYENGYALNYSFDSTKPTTAVLGVETTLPTVSGTNKETGESVDVYYTIAITKDGVDKSSMLNGNVFTPTEKGDYVVKYTIKNVFGTEAETFSFTISDVKDTKDPSVYYGKLVDDEIVDLSHTVPNNTSLKNIVLPAIYATDNSNGEITYKRQIYRVKTYTLDEGTIGSDNSKKAIILNYDEASFADVANISNYVIYNHYDNALNDSDKQAFTDGTYTVTYTALDASNNDVSKSYTMVMDEDHVVSTPEIEFGTVLPAEVKLGDTITFDVPTATDDNDERMIVKTFYKENGDSDWTEITESNVGEYNIETTKAGALTIKVEVTNDDGVSATPLIKTVNVIDMTDANAPTHVSTSDCDDVNAANNQFSEIELPAVTFTDTENIKYLNVVINVYDKNGNPITVSNKKITKDTALNTITVSDATFKASKSGAYTVCYIASDVAGNTAIYKFKTNEVTATVAPTIVKPIFDATTQDLELGQSLALPIPSVKDGDGEDVENPTYEVEVVSAEGEYDAIMLNKFTPKSVGKYVIRYVVTYTINVAGKIEVKTEKSPLYTINVVNTEAPTILNDFDSYTTLAKGATYSVDKLEVSANGQNDIDWSKTKIEILFNGSTYKTIELESAGDDDYSYTFSKDGEYSVKYTVYDKAGNYNTSGYTIKVGDIEKPVLEISSDIDFSDRLVGSTLVIDPSKITVRDTVDTEINIFDDLTITVENTSTSETISNKYSNETQIEGFEYDLSEVGTYNVTFTLKDAAGNTTSIVKEFVVTAEDAEKEFPTEIIGIMLLVLAILILGGVVAYFIITRKKVKTPEQIKKLQEKKDAKKRK